MSELTLHTGCAGSETTINVDWFDHNNASQKTTVVVRMQKQDKPRVLEILINGVRLAVVPSKYE